jgi:class 3 adenylate cyclase
LLGEGSSATITRVVNERPPLPQGTVTFLFTDIERSTDLVRLLGPRYGDVRAEHGRLLREAVEARGGHVVDTQGDAFFVAFEQAGDAVAAAIALQRALALADWPEDAGLRVRIGIHTAEPQLHDDGYVGIGVHRAARICAAAHGGQILLSNATAGIVEDRELPEVDLLDLGEYRLKDISRPQRLFQVASEGLETEFAPPAALADERPTPYGQAGTLLFVDIAMWGRTMRALGDDAAALFAADYHAIVEGAVDAHDGQMLEAVADNTLSVFARARDAILCASTVKKELKRHPWPDGSSLLLRAAVHTGRLVAKQFGGSAVFHCVSLCNSAKVDQILVSHSTHALLEGDVLPDIELRDLGERQLERIETPSRVFELIG